MSLLEVRDLKVSYTTRRGRIEALSGVSLALGEGEVVGVVGESGSGKSTLGQAILRLLPRYAHIEGGEVLFQGRNLLELEEDEMREIRGREIAMVFQDPYSSLNPVMRIIDHFSELYEEHGAGYTREEAAKLAGDILEKMGVPREKLLEYPHQMSGGQRQRVAIALGLALNPRLLIADEITTALDALVEAQIVDLLKEVRHTFKTSILFITHNMGLVAQLADKVTVMYAGKIVEFGNTRDVISSPLHPYTKALLASVPRIGGSKELQPIPGDPPDMRSPPPGCRFHPRCPLATEKCRSEEPPLKLKGDRLVACHYA
ncbi:MAG: ABC transporter ATP-binding protein [Infirmifilum sp.]|jgi:peptide/nickel transport system ATP-binding protein|uniref:Peptide ABC transporter ATPase n=1 Tax=Infirmifilum uzonense TaxID=1550241 RepID=A0A0F7FGU4_9CREN|nr:ABC transporter ATP-binding protein [Infirmifilum uzonense]AKG38389.1 peptide ABC transporter ATPase [Infirmifilum uzonense]